MKTSILLVAAFTLVAGYSVYQSQQKEQLSDIALENVEALADNELPNVDVVCSRNPGRCWARIGYLCMKGEYTGPACVRTSDTSKYCDICG